MRRFCLAQLRLQQRHALRRDVGCAGGGLNRAARLADTELGTRLERRLVDDLALFRSPSRGLDGAAIYRTALAEIGQPAPR